MSDTAAVPEEECVAVWCAGADWCAVTCTMEVIGRKWHPVIIHRLLNHGPLRFNELAEEVGAITNKVLTNSLKDLQAKALVNRTVINNQPVEVEYALTDRGRSLQPVIDALEAWGKTHLRPAETSKNQME